MAWRRAKQKKVSRKYRNGGGISAATISAPAYQAGGIEAASAKASISISSGS